MFFFYFQHHPDTSKGGGDPAQFQNVVEAYRVLSKQETRANYDAMQMRQQQWGYDNNSSRVDYRDYGRHPPDSYRSEHAESYHEFKERAERERAKERFYEEYVINIIGRKL